MVTVNEHVQCLSPTGLDVRWRRHIPGVKTLSEPVAGYIPVLGDRFLSLLSVADGKDKWSVAAQWGDRLLAWRDGQVIHLSDREIMVRDLNTGRVAQKVVGDLLTQYKGTFVLKDDDSIYGWADGEKQWEMPKPNADVVTWLAHDSGVFAVLRDGRWLSYAVADL